MTHLIKSYEFRIVSVACIVVTAGVNGERQRAGGERYQREHVRARERGPRVCTLSGPTISNDRQHSPLLCHTDARSTAFPFISSLESALVFWQLKFEVCCHWSLLDAHEFDSLTRTTTREHITREVVVPLHPPPGTSRRSRRRRPRRPKAPSQQPLRTRRGRRFRQGDVPAFQMQHGSRAVHGSEVKERG